MFIPWEGISTLSQSGTIVSFDYFHTPSLFEPSSWNSGKVKEAECSLFPVIKKWETQKGFCVQEPHRVLLGINFRKMNRFFFTNNFSAMRKKISLFSLIYWGWGFPVTGVLKYFKLSLWLALNSSLKINLCIFINSCTWNLTWSKTTVAVYSTYSDVAVGVQPYPLSSHTYSQKADGCEALIICLWGCFLATRAFSWQA